MLLFSIAAWETPSFIHGASVAGIVPSILPEERRKATRTTVGHKTVERTDPAISMSTVTIQTIDEWVKELDEFR